MKKLCVALCALLLMMSLSACGGDAVSPQSDPAAEKNETPETDNPSPLDEEPETENPFLLADFLTAPVHSGSGDIIGTYGYIKVEKDKVPDFDTTDFSRFIAEFADAKVSDSGLNWVSIMFDDGTGFGFPASFSAFAEYGKIDDEGCIIKGLGICMLSSDTGSFEYTDFGIREIPNPTLMQLGFVPDNSFAPAKEEIFSTPASENFLADTPFYAEGTVLSRFDLSGYDTIRLSTEKGDILISSALIDFPELSEGDQITAYFVYTGMSVEYELPCGIYIYQE